VAFRSDCPACEKLAGSGAYRDRIDVAGFDMPVVWLGGSGDEGRKTWTGTHGIENMMSIDEAVWAAAGISLVPYLVIVDRSGRLLESASPWPDHVAALSSEDMPLLAGCSRGS
jgi:hypothetical protein